MTSVLKVDNIQSSGGTQAIQIHSSGLIIPAAGGIIQTQYTQYTGTTSVSCTANTNTTLTDLTVNITPTSTSSIIKIEAMVNGEWSNQARSTDSAWFFYRDSTKLSHPTAGSRNTGVLMGTSITYYTSDAASTPEHAVYSYFDSPSTTSEITYKVGVICHNGGTWYLNRTVSDTNATNFERGVSHICVTEIAG